MFLTQLNLYHFKNHTETSLHFGRGLHLITGPNGCGKTNLLDAIWLCAFTKSFLNVTDAQLVQHGQSYYRVEGYFEQNSTTDEVVVTYGENNRKQVSVNGSKVERFADHLGRYPLVYVSPYDTFLLHDNSDERRRFIDMVCCSVSKDYFMHWKNYERVLQQRNALMKNASAGEAIPNDLLEHYDSLLHEAGTFVYAYRAQAIDKWNALFQTYAQDLAGTNERISLSYESPLHEKPLNVWLTETRRKDEILGRTSKGIHRDDLVFELNFDAEHSGAAKRFASQGQQKTILLALKFSVFRFLEHELARQPVLLLDDVFDKLDSKRHQNLLRILQSGNFEQVLIADTNADKVKGTKTDVSVTQL